MYKLEYLEIAKKDMDNIIYYISHNLKNKSAALKLIDEFLKEMNNIMNFPYASAEYISIKPLNNKYRKSRVKNFLIFYTINEENKTIMIVRVLYQKRNFTNLSVKIINISYLSTIILLIILLL